MTTPARRYRVRTVHGSTYLAEATDIEVRCGMLVLTSTTNVTEDEVHGSR